MGEKLESPCDFVLEGVDMEWVMRRKCPEMEGKAEGSMLNAKVRNNEDSTVSASGGEAVQQGAEIRGQSSDETPESRCDFSSQDAGDELVMPQKCPEIGGKAEG